MRSSSNSAKNKTTKTKPDKNPTTTFGAQPISNGRVHSSNAKSKQEGPIEKSKQKQDIKIPPGEFPSNKKIVTKSNAGPLSPSFKDNQPGERSTGSSVKSKTASFESNNENTQPTRSSAVNSHLSPVAATHSNTKIYDGITPSITHPQRNAPSTINSIQAGAGAGAGAGARERSERTLPGRGLKNLGNTCFMNCVLQCLSHTLSLREYFVSGSYKQHLKKSKGSLSAAFTKVLEDLWSSYTQSFSPYELKKEVERVAPRFSGYNQHDAQEFMRFLLNEVHEEINQADVKGRRAPGDNETLKDACARYRTWEDSRIIDLFCGMLKSTICCAACNHKSFVYDPFMDLALPIPKSAASPVATKPFFGTYSIYYDSSNDAPVPLGDCYDLFTLKEILNDEERPYCNKCKKSTNSTKQLLVAKLPDVLVIQLKRFSGYSVRRKLSTPVTYNETWTLEDESRVKHHYSLYGIVSHSGGIYGGHYKAYCKHRGQWRCFNDSSMDTKDWAFVKSQEAYILFYARDVEDVAVSKI